jgi:putative addiction module component (TIGR02574 family)
MATENLHVSVTPQDVLDAALKLSAPQRAEVVQRLLDSLSPQAETLLDDAWAAELDKRLAEFESGEADAVPWSQLKLEK